MFRVFFANLLGAYRRSNNMEFWQEAKHIHEMGKKLKPNFFSYITKKTRSKDMTVARATDKFVRNPPCASQIHI